MRRSFALSIFSVGCVRDFASAIDPGRSNGVPHISHKDIEKIPFAAAACRAAPDRVRIGRVAGGSGRAEAPASRDRRRVGRLAPRHPRPRLQRRIMNPKELLEKLPLVRSWIDRTLAEHSNRAQPVASYRFPRLGGFYSSEFLTTAKVVEVERVPMPPLSALGLTGFGEFETGNYAGITFLDTYFVQSGEALRGIPSLSRTGAYRAVAALGRGTVRDGLRAWLSTGRRLSRQSARSHGLRFAGLF